MKLLPFQFTAVCSTLTSVTGAAATDLLTKAAHGLLTGDAVIPTFSAGFGNLTSGNRYYAIWVSSSTFKLASTLALALAGTAIDIGSDGTGMTVAIPTPLKSAAYRATSCLLSPQAEGNTFPAYVGWKNSNGNPDPRTPITVANAAVGVQAEYDLNLLFILAASGDGVDVFGFISA